MRVCSIALAALSILLLSCAGGGPAHAIAPQSLPEATPADFESCTRAAPMTSGRLSLAGIDKSVATAIDRGVAAGHVVALHMEASGCNTQIEVLQCTRAVPYVPDTQGAPPPPTFLSRRDLAKAGSVAGFGTLLALAGRAGADATGAESFAGYSATLEEMPVDLRSLSLGDELTRANPVARYGPMKVAPLPSFYADEVSGPDCARMTHVVYGVAYGTYRVTKGAPPPHGAEVDASNCRAPACIEPIAIDVAELRRYDCVWTATSRGACVPLQQMLTGASASVEAALRTARSRTCNERVPIPGKVTTDQAVTARRLFQARKWGDALLGLVRIANGETGDDLGNQWIAEYETAIAAERVGGQQSADATLAHIARMPCHPRHDEAAYFMTDLELHRGPAP